MRNPDKRPRTAYCTGCGLIFPKMHYMISHRRTERCGGRFLSQPERDSLNAIRRIREAQDRIQRVLKQGAR